MKSAELARFVRFVGIVMLAHIVTYFVAGAIAYPTLTKQFYEGPNPIFASFMRTPAQPDSWRHAANRFLPENLLRGVRRLGGGGGQSHHVGTQGRKLIFGRLPQQWASQTCAPMSSQEVFFSTTSLWYCTIP